MSQMRRRRPNPNRSGEDRPENAPPENQPSTPQSGAEQPGEPRGDAGQPNPNRPTGQRQPGQRSGQPRRGFNRPGRNRSNQPRPVTNRGEQGPAMEVPPPPVEEQLITPEQVRTDRPIIDRSGQGRGNSGRGGRNRPGRGRNPQDRANQGRPGQDQTDQERAGQERSAQDRPVMERRQNRSDHGRSSRGPAGQDRTNRPEGGRPRQENASSGSQRRDRQGQSRLGPSQPRKTDKGIQARSQKGSFAQNWWAARWIIAMERLVDNGRLQRGRNYARQGQVLNLDEIDDGMQARVQGSQRQPYRVTIRVSPLSDAHWDLVLDALAGQALFTAQLLAGEMPREIEQVFQAAGVSLFPERLGELQTDCSCPDHANPCKHVAATHYILGERFDEDPFLLFRLRGRSQEQILAGLRQRRTGDEAGEEAEEVEDPVQEELTPALDESLEGFWEPGESLEEIAVTVRAPAVDGPLLKRLGDPAFLPDMQDQLLPAYHAIMRFALAVGGESPAE